MERKRPIICLKVVWKGRKLVEDRSVFSKPKSENRKRYPLPMVSCSTLATEDILAFGTEYSRKKNDDRLRRGRFRQTNNLYRLNSQMSGKRSTLIILRKTKWRLFSSQDYKDIAPNNTISEPVSDVEKSIILWRRFSIS